MKQLSKHWTLAIWTSSIWIAFCLLATPLPYGFPKSSLGYGSIFWHLPDVVQNLLLITVWPTYPALYFALIPAEMIDHVISSYPFTFRVFTMHFVLFAFGLIINFCGWWLLFGLATLISKAFSRLRQA